MRSPPPRRGPPVAAGTAPLMSAHEGTLTAGSQARLDADTAVAVRADAVQQACQQGVPGVSANAYCTDRWRGRCGARRPCARRGTSAGRPCCAPARRPCVSHDATRTCESGRHVTMQYVAGSRSTRHDSVRHSNRATGSCGQHRLFTVGEGGKGRWNQVARADLVDRKLRERRERSVIAEVRTTLGWDFWTMGSSRERIWAWALKEPEFAEAVVPELLRRDRLLLGPCVNASWWPRRGKMGTKKKGARRKRNDDGQGMYALQWEAQIRL